MAASMKALIAYDGSDCADAALDDLKRAGLPGQIEAMVVTVAELWLPPPPITFKPFLTAAAEPFPAPAEAARNLTIEATRRLQTIFPTWDIRAEALVGSPYARERGDGRSGARALLGRSRPHEKECVMENSPDEMLRQVVGAIGNEVQPSAAVHSLK